MPGYDMQTLRTTAEAAAVAALAYTGGDGAPRVVPVTPILQDGLPAFTLTYARSDLARELAASGRAVLVFSDSRLAYVGWSPLSAPVRVEVAEDPEGEAMREGLLEQELRKFPPDRHLVGSLLLQRENWWYMGRWVVRAVPVEAPRPVARRSGPDHGILAHGGGEGLAAETVSVRDWEADPIVVRGLAAGAAEGLPAALYSEDFALPDMDPRAHFLAEGRLEGDRLHVLRSSGSRALGARPGLIARWSAHRELRRRCKAGLAQRPRGARGPQA